MRIFAVIPAYNEQSVIGQVVSQVKNLVNEVVVVDDGSQDGTGHVAGENGARVLHHLVNRGQGAALRTGTDWAVAQGADIVVHIDADGQHEPLELKQLLEPVLKGEAEVAIGSRFLKKENRIPAARRLILKAAILFTWFFSGIKLSDAHNGFRVLSRRAASLINISQDRMAHASEIIDEISRNKLIYREIPVSVKYTAYSLGKGQRSWALFKIARDLLLGKFLGS